MAQAGSSTQFLKWACQLPDFFQAQASLCCGLDPQGKLGLQILCPRPHNAYPPLWQCVLSIGVPRFRGKMFSITFLRGSGVLMPAAWGRVFSALSSCFLVS